jgi:hypothetical protein
MKDQLASLLRHAFTGWIAAIVILLTAKLSLGADDVKAVQDALNQIGAGVLMLVVTLAPILGRLVWAWGANAFRSGTGETENNGKSGGASLLCVFGTAAALMTTVLPSCSASQWAAARAIPIRIGIAGPDAALNYSSKAGLELNAVIRAEK